VGVFNIIFRKNKRPRGPTVIGLLNSA